MTETLLSTSNVLLFGRVVADLQIIVPNKKVPTADDIRVLVATNQHVNISGKLNSPFQRTLLSNDSLILLFGQNNHDENGVYFLEATKNASGKVITGKFSLESYGPLPDRSNVYVRRGDFAGNIYTRESGNVYSIAKDRTHSPFSGNRPGAQGQLQKQLENDLEPKFARVYGFAFEGTYYELPSPILFLVHGDGTEASLPPLGRGERNTARMPGTPSITGIAAADYNISDDVRVWSYDKGDFSIRMDVETGMIEDILLGPVFGGDGGGGGGRLSGAKVSGAKVSGAKVSGAKVAGAKLSGRWDPSD